MSAIDNINARFSSFFAPLSARVDATLDSMSPRDRKLAVGLVVVALVVVVGGGFWLMQSSLSSLERQIGERASDLQFVQLQQAEYESAKGDLERIEDELRRHKDTRFSSFVEKNADDAQIREKLRGIKETSVTQIGNLEQKNHNVELTRVTLDELLNFLYGLEGSGYPLRVTNANLKVVMVSGEKHLNVRLDVASFHLIEEETSEEG